MLVLLRELTVGLEPYEYLSTLHLVQSTSAVSLPLL